MFTGIVEGKARVLEVLPRAGAARRLVLDLGPLAGEVRLGDSVAIDGTCLTAVEIAATRVSFDVIQETLDKTTLGELTPGGVANVERPMKVDARFHGHVVTGHVDGTGRIRLIDPQPGQVRMEIALDPALGRYLVPKGSVTVDGISLTVVDAEREWFSIALIPHTLEVTTLGTKRQGSRVNLEMDAIGKWVERLLQPWR